MNAFSKAAPIVVALVALLPASAAANRNLVVTPLPVAGAPFTIEGCRGTDIHDLRRFVDLGSSFTNVSGKDIKEIGVYYRLLQLDGTKIIGFGVVHGMRVTAGTKNNFIARLRVDFTGIDHAECAAAYAKFSDGTEWKSTFYGESAESPQPSSASATAPSPAPAPSSR